MFEEYLKILKTGKTAYLKIRVKPGAPKTLARETMADGTIKVDVAAPANENKANAALVKYLSKTLAVSAGRIALVTGANARTKLIKIIP